MTIRYTWSEFDEDIYDFCRWSREHNYRPDLIVGIVRGGVTAAISLSHAFKVPCKFIEWSTRDSGKRITSEVDRIAASAENGKKILVIDDILDTGKTITELKDRMFDVKGNVMWGTLWFNPSQPCTIDWYARIVDRATDARWVTMPWARLKNTQFP